MCPHLEYFYATNASGSPRNPCLLSGVLGTLLFLVDRAARHQPGREVPAEESPLYHTLRAGRSHALSQGTDISQGNISFKQVSTYILMI